jgi:hypothetical protein
MGHAIYRYERIGTEHTDNRVLNRLTKSAPRRLVLVCEYPSKRSTSARNLFASNDSCRITQSTISQAEFRVFVNCGTSVIKQFCNAVHRSPSLLVEGTLHFVVATMTLRGGFGMQKISSICLAVSRVCEMSHK